MYNLLQCDGYQQKSVKFGTNNVIVQKLQIATHWKGLSYAYQTSVWQTHWWQIASMDCLYRPMVTKDTIFLSVITGFKNSFWCHEETHYVWAVVIIARKNRENPPYEDKTHSNIYSTPKMCYWVHTLSIKPAMQIGKQILGPLHRIYNTMQHNTQNCRNQGSFVSSHREENHDIHCQEGIWIYNKLAAIWIYVKKLITSGQMWATRHNACTIAYGVAATDVKWDWLTSRLQYTWYYWGVCAGVSAAAVWKPFLQPFPFC